MGLNKSKDKVAIGQPTNAQIAELSKKFNLTTQRINLLKQKYNMYRGRNNKINIHNYYVLYREFINANSPDIEIFKSFNAFDVDRDGFIDFIELIRAVSLQTNKNQAPIPIAPPPAQAPAPQQPPQQSVYVPAPQPEPTMYQVPIEPVAYTPRTLHVVRNYRSRSPSPLPVRYVQRGPVKIRKQRLRLPRDYSYRRSLTRCESPLPRGKLRRITIYVPKKVQSSYSSSRSRSHSPSHVVRSRRSKSYDDYYDNYIDKYFSKYFD